MMFRTGALRWTFRVIPKPGEFGSDTWADGSSAYTGAANVWSMMSADDDLGYVYLPTSSPTSDMYGGHRLGDNLFSSSIVCVDARTGKRIWHFQTVHHDLFDDDNPAAPILLDVTVGGRRIKALAQVTKQGLVFVLDRETGRPVWPIEERPVPIDRTGRADIAHPADSDQASALRATRAAARRSHRLHTRAARGSGRDRKAIRPRTALHAAIGAR